MNKIAATPENAARITRLCEQAARVGRELVVYYRQPVQYPSGITSMSRFTHTGDDRRHNPSPEMRIENARYHETRHIHPCGEFEIMCYRPVPIVSEVKQGNRFQPVYR